MAQLDSMMYVWLHTIVLFDNADTSASGWCQCKSPTITLIHLLNFSAQGTLGVDSVV